MKTVICADRRKRIPIKVTKYVGVDEMQNVLALHLFCHGKTPKNKSSVMRIVRASATYSNGWQEHTNHDVPEEMYKEAWDIVEKLFPELFW